MISYTMVGTTDLARALRFYGPLFAEMGLEQCWLDETSASWGRTDDIAVPRFSVGYPFDEKPASAGNGVMTAFLVPEPARIDRLHALALRNGGSDEGPPGLRPNTLAGFTPAMCATLTATNSRSFVTASRLRAQTHKSSGRVGSALLRANAWACVRLLLIETEAHGPEMRRPDARPRQNDKTRRGRARAGFEVHTRCACD